jgi:hypothetical protein
MVRALAFDSKRAAHAVADELGHRERHAFAARVPKHELAGVEEVREFYLQSGLLARLAASSGVWFFSMTPPGGSQNPDGLYTRTVSSWSDV